MTKDIIFERVIEILHELFEIPKEDIALKTRLYQDLDLDSIDAVDLVVKLQEITDKKISPETFKEVRTVNDVVDAVHAILSE